MGRNEIERNLVLHAKADKGLDPFRCCGRWSADAQPRINQLNRASSSLVEFAIRLELRLARPELDIRLVPDLKEPLYHFVDAVALAKVLYESENEFVPLGVAARGRNTLMIPKGVEDFRVFLFFTSVE
jgi:hypothetical protein